MITPHEESCDGLQRGRAKQLSGASGRPKGGYCYGDDWFAINSLNEFVRSGGQTELRQHASLDWSRCRGQGRYRQYRHVRLTSHCHSPSATYPRELPRVERCSTNQTTVDVSLREEIVGVCRFDTAAIENARPLGER